MRSGSLSLSRIVGVGLVLSASAGVAYADDTSLPLAYVAVGSHWYVAQSSTDSVGQLLGSGELIAGPFPTQQACDVAKPKDTGTLTYKCVNSDAPDFAIRSPIQNLQGAK